MRSPRYADVASTLALVVALSGSAYAVANLPAKSVGTHQLKSKAVTSKKIRDWSIRAQDLQPGSGLAPGSASTVANRRVAPCAETVLISRHLTPRVTSRVLGLAAGTWTASQGAGFTYDLDSFLQLRASGTVVAKTVTLTNQSVGEVNQKQPLGTSGVLVAADGKPYALQAKAEYDLELVVHTYGTPCANQPLVEQAQLSYALLADRD